VAVSQQTLRLAAERRASIDDHVDAATRELVAAWVLAWNTINGEWSRAIDDVVDLTDRGRWPNQRQLLDVTRIQQALATATRELDQLAARTGATVTETAIQVTEQTAFWEARIIASQLPATVAPGAQILATRFSDIQLQAIVERTTQQIESAANRLAPDAATAMRRALIRGTALGANPRHTAARMLRTTETHFNGGLARALTIARTETLDAQRTAAQVYQQAHQDTLKGWVWTCKLDARSCPSCWARHGTVHPLTEPGPNDHQQGRCARTPVTKTWAELGIAIPEPPSSLPDAEARFASLSRADRLAIMGPARLQALEDGTLQWDQLSVNVTNPGWRDSWVPVSVRQTQRHVERSA
jgi:hypothetical protein